MEEYDPVDLTTNSSYLAFLTLTLDMLDMQTKHSQTSNKLRHQNYSSALHNSLTSKCENLYNKEDKKKGTNKLVRRKSSTFLE